MQKGEHVCLYVWRAHGWVPYHNCKIKCFMCTTAWLVHVSLVTARTVLAHVSNELLLFGVKCRFFQWSGAFDLELVEMSVSYIRHCLVIKLLISGSLSSAVSDCSSMRTAY